MIIDFNRNTELFTSITNKTFDLCVIIYSHSNHYNYFCNL